MTTYDTNSNPIQVNVLEGSVNNVNLGVTRQEHNYSRVYKNYEANQSIQMCFAAGTDQTVIAVAAFLGPKDTNDELRLLSFK